LTPQASAAAVAQAGTPGVAAQASVVANESQIALTPRHRFRVPRVPKSGWVQFAIVAGLVLAGVAIWPTFAFNDGGHASLALPEWTATKDYREYCLVMLRVDSFLYLTLPELLNA
jgi:hypothetical protein